MVAEGANVIVDEHCIMCNIKPEFASQVCMDKHAENLVHDGEVESLSVQSLAVVSFRSPSRCSLLMGSSVAAAASDQYFSVLMEAFQCFGQKFWSSPSVKERYQSVV